MSFVVLARIGDKTGTQYLYLQNLVASFGCPNGRFILARKDMDCVTPLTLDTCRIEEKDWNKLTVLTSAMIKELNEKLGIAE